MSGSQGSGGPKNWETTGLDWDRCILKGTCNCLGTGSTMAESALNDQRILGVPIPFTIKIFLCH